MSPSLSEPLASVHDYLDLGPTRVPLFIDLKDFSAYLNKNPHPSTGPSDLPLLYHYLGSRGDSPSGASVSASRLFNRFLQYQLLEKNCIIFLDGDVDFPSSSQGSLLQEVHAFIDKFCAPENFKSSSTNISWKAKTFDEDQPFLRGGNQVLISASRIGFYSNFMSSKFGMVYLTAENFNAESVKHIAKLYMHDQKAAAPDVKLEKFLVSSDFLETAKTMPLLIKTLVPFFLILCRFFHGFLFNSL